MKSTEAQQSRSTTLRDWIIALVGAGALVWLILWSGFHLNFVATDSMVPTYNPTDVVATVGTSVIEPGIGDAVVFDTELYGTEIPPHVHRIVGQDERGFITQGDNAAKPDPWRVDPDRIHGKVIFSFPGWILRSPLVLALILFGFGVAAFWPTRNSELEDEPEAVPPPAMPHGSIQSRLLPSQHSVSRREDRLAALVESQGES